MLKTNYELPIEIRKALPDAAATILRKSINQYMGEGFEFDKAVEMAWDMVKLNWERTQDGWVRKRHEVQITKIDEDRRLVFGWISVIEYDDQPVVDSQGDVILSEDLEKAAYAFVKSNGVAGDNHERVGVGQLVESIVFTKEKQIALGIDLGCVGWFGGFYISDDDVWNKVKKGEYLAFSIGGIGTREEIEI